MTRKFVIFPLVLFLSLTACDDAEERAEKHFQSATALIEAGDISRAKVEFRNVFKLNPTHQSARRSYAGMLEEAGETGAALRQYLLLVEQYPEDRDATLALARLAVLARNWEQAERYGRRAARMAPDDPIVKIVVTILDYRQASIDGDTVRRAEMAARAEAQVQEHPDNISLRRTLADWYIFQDRERDALAQIDAVIAITPDDLSNYVGRLQILTSLGELPEVENQLRQMVERFPDNERIRIDLIRWYMSQGDTGSAEAFLRELTTQGDAESREKNQVALIQFLGDTRGREAALDELDLILAATDNPDLFRLIRAGLVFDRGDREAAIAELRTVLEEAEPSDQTRRIMVGLANMQRLTGNPVAARALIEQVLAEDPVQVDALKVKAQFLIEGDKADEAIVLLRQAQGEAPRDAAILTLTAMAYERNGNRDLMGEMLALAVEVSNRAVPETLRLTNFLISRGQFAPAEQSLVEALRLAPDNLTLLERLGGLYLRMDRPNEALGVENKLRSLDSDEARNIADRIRLTLLQVEHRTQDIISMIEDLSRDKTDKTGTTLAIMRAYLANGDVKAAVAALTSARAKDPENLELRFAEAVLTGIEGDQEGARAGFREVIAARPQAANAWLALVRSYEVTGDADRAEAVLDQALQALPDTDDLKWAKAGYLERRGDIDGAIEVYEGLYDARSSSLVAANNLASLLSSYRADTETIERAYAIARRLRGIPQPAFQDTYGWIAFLRGELEEALDNLRPAAAGLPEDPLVQYHLARAYEADGQTAEAVAQFKRALDVLGAGTNPAMADASARLDRLVAKLDAQEAGGE